MPRPEFSETEQYLIHSLQNEIPFQNRNESARKSLLATAAIATFAFYHDSIVLMLAAFAMHLGFLAYDDYKANLCVPIWKSVVEKYESALSESNEPASNEC